MAITQKFIAEQVGVSQKTVSQYFQGKARIADTTRSRLENVIARYGYFPNLAARSIKTKRFKRIACLLIHNQVFPDQGFQAPHLLSYINAAAAELSQHGYSLVIEPFKVNNDRRILLDSPESFATLSVDGIIGIAGGWVPPEIDQTIRRMNIPVIWLNRHDLDYGQPEIHFDEASGAAELTEYLLAQGKTEIAWFGSDFAHLNGHHSSRDRYQAVVETLRKNGRKLNRTIFNRMGRSLCPSALELFAGGNRPDAVISYNHGFCEAAEQAALYCGLRPGYDFQSVHFASNWEYSPASCDFRTFVILPEEKAGKRGAQYIYNRINGQIQPELLKPIPTGLHIGIPFEQHQ